MAYFGGKLQPWFKSEPIDVFMRNAPVLVAGEAKDIAMKKTPIDTGDLREAWTADKVAGKAISLVGVGFSASWANDTDYAAYVNYGTGLWGPEHKKYLIVPKDPDGTLHWVDRKTGHDKYAKAVLHPGSPGHFMLEISADEIEATWPRIVQPLLRVWARVTERQNPYAT